MESPGNWLLESMKVNDPNLSSAAAGAPGAKQAERTGKAGRADEPRANGAAAGDDVHLSELVRSLRSLAAESPERQERIEQIARAYAEGNYKVDAEAVAEKIIDDALHYR
jgi:negative regulator of flagellin synthesis FlgM